MQTIADLYDLLLHHQPIPAKAWLPASPEPSSPEEVVPVPIYKDPLPGTVPQRNGKFIYPPKKRLREKTPDCGQASSSTPSAAALSSLEAGAQDAEAAYWLALDDADPPAEEDLSADEEAAAHMRA